MTESSEAFCAPRRRLGRWKWVRLGVGLIIALWLGWFGYVRWTTLPAAAAKQTVAEQPAIEAVLNLFGLVNRLPPPTQATTSGPWYPWGWWEPFGAALCGCWDPAASEDVRQVEAYLAKPATTSRLDQIVSECEEVREISREGPLKDLGRYGGPLLWSSYEIDAAVAVLAARARRRHAVDDDLPGALRDLQAAMYLRALGREGGLTYGGWTSGATPDLAELLFLAQERDLPAAAAAETIALLTEELPTRFSEALARLSLGQGGVEGFLDRHYTNDGAGNGWLVLSSTEPHPAAAALTATGPRSGVWNLFSPIFNDRRTVAAKLYGLEQALSRVDEQAYGEAMNTLRVWGARRAQMNVLDGPAGIMLYSLDFAGLEPVMQDVVWRRAAAVMVALSAYKHNHGAYPEALAELVPDYLRAVPKDLLANRPFVYERSDGSNYVLRSARSIPAQLKLVLMHGRARHGAENAYSAPRPDAEE